jgi:spore coat protein U-like protein
MKTLLNKLMFILFCNITLLNSIYGAEDGTVTCTITCTNIVFTAFNPYDANFERVNGSMTVKCTNSGVSKSITYYIGSQGGNSTDYSARYVKNGTNNVSYNIYIDAAYTQILGDTSNRTSYITTTYTLAKNGSRTDSYTIYGKIPVQPLAKPMTYTDSLICGVQYNY